MCVSFARSESLCLSISGGSLATAAVFLLAVFALVSSLDLEQRVTSLQILEIFSVVFSALETFARRQGEETNTKIIIC